MIRRGWCRNLINQQTGRIKQIFRWAVSEEMVSPGVWHALLSCPGLRRGKTEARESDPVKPVPLADIEAAKNYLRPAVAAMVDFARFTGCRPNEVCQLRPRDLDQADPRCWVFRPSTHKNEHHGHERPILVGPKAQAVLLPFLDGCGPDEFVFSPTREVERRNAERRANRKTKLTQSAITRAEVSLRRPRRRGPKARYTTASLRRAIKRACKLAGIAAFGPNRLRHTRATELRPHGLDVVATILGHAKLETTQIYSEKNLATAMEVVASVG
jgi:integrase